MIIQLFSDVIRFSAGLGEVHRKAITGGFDVFITPRIGFLARHSLDKLDGFISGRLFGLHRARATHEGQDTVQILQLLSAKFDRLALSVNSGFGTSPNFWLALGRGRCGLALHFELITRRNPRISCALELRCVGINPGVDRAGLATGHGDEPLRR